MADYQDLTDGRPAGARLGQSASDLVGFHGAAPTAQSAVLTCISTSVAVSGAFGFTSVQANAIIANQNALIDYLKTKGLIAAA